MANKAQILVKGHNFRQSTAPSGPGKATNSHKTVKQDFPTGKCVMSTQNQADFKAQTTLKGVKRKLDAGFLRSDICLLSSALCPLSAGENIEKSFGAPDN